MITFGTLRAPIVPLAEGGLPLLEVPGPLPLPETFALLGEEPGRRLVPRTPSLLPYTSQSRYTRNAVPTDTPVAVLENDDLRATFLLDLGGRLWSLFDKRLGRELLFQPDEVVLGNLALRDAWFSGGTEWNLGVTGHWGKTCEPVCAGVAGDSVLRMWTFERLTRLVWRVEAALDGDRLLIGVRLHNPHDEAVPLYWWSNTAVPIERGRVLVDASSALWHGYDRILVRRGWPEDHPELSPRSADYFFEINAPWQASVDDEGYGLLQTSTPELHGRKLFVWGDGPGGRRWQSWLNGSGRYVEVQAGYARSQPEHVALEPGASVSWIESYGPTRVGPDGVPEVRELPNPFSAVAGVAPVVWRASDGWGWLEVEAGQLPADQATPFVPDGGASSEWAGFAAGGAVPEVAETVTGSPWVARLTDAPQSAWQSLHLGYALWAAGRRGEAVDAWRRSVEIEPTPQALRALSHASTDGWDRFDYLERAWQLDPENPELLVEYLVLAGQVSAIVGKVIDALPPELRALPRVRLAECRALIAVGRLDEAKVILDDIELPNLREGDGDLTDLWEAWTEASGTDDPLPERLDFRMH